MGERYAIFDPATGRQIGKSLTGRKEALAKYERLRQRGPGRAPVVVRHDQERKREDVR